MLAAGHEDKSKEDHCVRMLAMAKVEPAGHSRRARVYER